MQDKGFIHGEVKVNYNYYENALIFNPDLDEKQTQEAIEKVKEVITREGGEILKVENWGCRETAYEVRKHKKGVYVFLVFTAPPTAIAPLERFFRVFDPVLKFMVIKLKKKQVRVLLAELSGGDREAQEYR